MPTLPLEVTDEVIVVSIVYDVVLRDRLVIALALSVVSATHIFKEALRIHLVDIFALLGFLHMIKVPVAVKTWAHDLKIVDDIEGEVDSILLLSSSCSLTIGCWFL